MMLWLGYQLTCKDCQVRWKVAEGSGAECWVCGKNCTPVWMMSDRDREHADRITAGNGPA